MIFIYTPENNTREFNESFVIIILELLHCLLILCVCVFVCRTFFFLLLLSNFLLCLIVFNHHYCWVLLFPGSIYFSTTIHLYNIDVYCLIHLLIPQIFSFTMFGLFPSSIMLFSGRKRDFNCGSQVNLFISFSVYHYSSMKLNINFIF